MNFRLIAAAAYSVGTEFHRHLMCADGPDGLARKDLHAMMFPVVQCPRSPASGTGQRVPSIRKLRLQETN